MASDDLSVQLTADPSISAARSRNRRRSIARGDAVMGEAARVAAEARADLGSESSLAGQPTSTSAKRRHGRRRSVAAEQMDALYEEMRAKDSKVELFPFVR